MKIDKHTCVVCGDEIPGELEYIDDEGPLCEECYEMTKAAIAAANENYRL